MSITPYLVGGTAITIGLAVGYVKYMERGTAADKAEAKTAIVRAECVTNTAEEVNTTALGQIASLTAEVNRQKEIAAAHKKKAEDRLRENNLLRRNIQNVTENPPVPLAIERVLDGMRGADTGTGNGGVDQGPSGEAAGADRPIVQPTPKPAPETPIG